MPFERFTPHAFTPFSVRTNAPAASGIYGVSNAREWIYIGETDNIQTSLLILRGNASLSEHSPTGFVFELCPRAARLARQDRLILEYGPTHNRRPEAATGEIA